MRALDAFTQAYVRFPFFHLATMLVALPFLARLWARSAPASNGSRKVLRNIHDWNLPIYMYVWTKLHTFLSFSESIKANLKAEPSSSFPCILLCTLPFTLVPRTVPCPKKTQPPHSPVRLQTGWVGGKKWRERGRSIYPPKHWGPSGLGRLRPPFPH